MRSDSKSHGCARPLMPLVLVATLVLVLFMTACRSRKVVAEAQTTEARTVETEQKTIATHDTVILLEHDSVFIKAMGDTISIYKERWRDRTVYRYRDTAIFVGDTVRITETVETVKEVAKPDSKFEKVQKASAWILWTIVACVIAYCILRNSL